MVSDQKIYYKDKDYQIIAVEQEFIIHPTAFDLIPLTNAATANGFYAEYYLDGYNLYLEKLALDNTDNINMQYQFNNCRISYTGSILIVSDMVKEYNLKNEFPACFSYLNVKELIFNDGVLTTTIDQNKAMLRVRKNLELGLRSLDNKRDLRCIKHFLSSAFAGNYKPFRMSVTKMRYIREMKKCYDKEKLTFIQL